MSRKRVSRAWTKKELTALKKAKDIHAFANKIGRSYAAVSQQRLRMNLDPITKPAAEPSYKEDKEVATETHWKAQHNILHGKYRRALKDAALTEKLVEDIKELAPRSYKTAPAIVKTRKKSSGSAQSAMLLFSDCHLGKVTLPEQTLGFSSYNFDVFLARLKYVEDSIISIMKEHVNTEVPELVIAMLGDMLDGALGHGVEGGLRNTMFTQFYAGGHAIAQFLRNIAQHVPQIRIETVVGNHTRWQNQRRMPTENRFSNMDMVLYALIEALTSDIKNIKWNLNQQPFQIFDVQGFTFFAAHGDHLKGGDKALGIPNHAFGRQISTTTQLFTKNDAKSPNYYVSGHLHRSITLPHALGDVMVNGGFPGLDNYALSENFSPVDPTQRFFFVHPRYGRTATYELGLKHAVVKEERPYEIPGAFPIE